MKNKGTRAPASTGSQAARECKAEAPSCSKSITTWSCTVSTKYGKSALDASPHFPITEKPDVKHWWTQWLQSVLRSRMVIYLSIYYNTLNRMFNWLFAACYQHSDLLTVHWERNEEDPKRGGCTWESTDLRKHDFFFFFKYTSSLSSYFKN